MKKLEVKLTETKIEVTNWSLNVNDRNLESLLSSQLPAGKFIGNVTITITETAPFIEPETETTEE